MRLAVLKERRASETRVAATPDTVKRLVGLGLTVAIESGAGAEAAIPDQEFAAAGAEIAPDAGAASGRCRNRVRGANAAARTEGADPAWDSAGLHRQRLRRTRTGSEPRGSRHRLRGHGTAAAHHPRAGDGRAVEPVEPRRLSRGDRGGRRIPAWLPDDDDCRRDGAAGAPVRDRRRRGRPTGDRHRAAAGRDRFRHRRASRREGGDQVAGWQRSSAWRTRRRPARPVPMHAR